LRPHPPTQADINNINNSNNDYNNNIIIPIPSPVINHKNKEKPLKTARKQERKVINKKQERKDIRRKQNNKLNTESIIYKEGNKQENTNTNTNTNIESNKISGTDYNSNTYSEPIEATHLLSNTISIPMDSIEIINNDNDNDTIINNNTIINNDNNNTIINKNNNNDNTIINNNNDNTIINNNNNKLKIKILKDDLETQSLLIKKIGYTVKLNDKNKSILYCNYPGCNCTFSSKYYVNKHIKIHITTMPYQCPLCFNKFIRQDNAKVHLKICEKKMKIDV
ncbi:hypothetical protein CDIK_3798, partial [Cucumispora dikerogammari]